MYSNNNRLLELCLGSNRHWVIPVCLGSTSGRQPVVRGGAGERRVNLPGTTKVFKVKGLVSGKAWIREHGDRDGVAAHVVSLPSPVSGTFQSLSK